MTHNWICRLFGHKWFKIYADGRMEIKPAWFPNGRNCMGYIRHTCWRCGELKDMPERP